MTKSPFELALECAASISPCAESWVRGAGKALALELLDAGRSPMDAVLGTIFAGMQQGGPDALGLTDGFWNHIMATLNRIGGRKSKNTSVDALQSAICSVLMDTRSLYFETEVQFLQLLRTRMDFKRMKEFSRRRAELLDTRYWGHQASVEPGTATKVAEQESMQRFHQLLSQLSPRDEALVLARLRLPTTGDALESLGMNNPAGRKAMSRAFARLRRLLYRDGHGDDDPTSPVPA